MLCYLDLLWQRARLWADARRSDITADNGILSDVKPQPDRRRTWRRVGEAEFIRRQEVGLLIDHLRDQKHPDLARVVELRASGKAARVALVSDDLRVIEVLER